MGFIIMYENSNLLLYIFFYDHPAFVKDDMEFYANKARSSWGLVY